MTKRISSKIVHGVQMLRAQGWTTLELSTEFNIGRATVNRYIKNIKILPQYEDLWLSKRNGSVRRKEKAEQKAEQEAKKLVNSLSNKEKIIVLSSLYWAEGAKIDSNLTNTDPDLIRVFTKGLKDLIGIKSDRLKLNIRIYEDMNKDECINYWLNVTDLKKENLSSVNVLVGKKKGKLKYGMCRVRITKGGDVLKYLVAVRNAIIANF